MHGARTIRAGRIGEWRVVVSRGNYRRSIGEFSRKREKMGIISKVLESNSYEITKDSNSAIVKAQKRVFTRVDAAIFCAAISGRKREE